MDTGLLAMVMAVVIVVGGLAIARYSRGRDATGVGPVTFELSEPL